MLEGNVRHRDSLGNMGIIGPGDVQWMTSGRGILHEEMPRRGPSGIINGFQLWVNLPAAQKMSQPRYQEVSGRHGNGDGASGCGWWRESKAHGPVTRSPPSRDMDVT
jgi:redox-sensitive bicupin YhaK (pirin superfamily)